MDKPEIRRAHTSMRRALRRRARRLVAVAQSFLELRPFADARPSAERGAEGGARATGKSALITGLVRAVSGPPLPCSDSQTALCSPAVTATASAAAGWRRKWHSRREPWRWRRARAAADFLTPAGQHCWFIESFSRWALGDAEEPDLIRSM